MPSLMTLSHYIEFPKLGWKLPLDDTLAEFRIGGMDFTIKWYGVMIAIGFILAVMYALYRAKDFGIDPDRMIDIALVTTPIAFVGARLYYVFFSADAAAYLADPVTILYIWKGGLGIYGGVIFAFAFGPLICRWRKQSPLAMMDIASMGFLIGQACGRWGNFFNQEAFGGNTDLPWGMTGDMIQAGIHGSGYDTAMPVHPTFLYESLWCILGFVVLHIISKRLYKFKGQLFCSYIIWYGVGRFFIEATRTDSLMIGTMKASQLVAILAIVGGVLGLWFLHRRAQALPKTLLADGDTTLDLPTEDGEKTEEETETNADESADEEIPEEETDNGNEN